MPNKMIECPICRTENWAIVRGRFTCMKEGEHTPNLIVDAVLRYANTMNRAKEKLTFVADVVGPSAVYEMDERIVTLLYTDGVKFVIKLQEIRGDATVVTVSVNGVTVAAPFAQLSGYTPEEFDAALVERLSGVLAYTARRS